MADEGKIRRERLKRSIVAAKSLRRAIKDSKKILGDLSAACLEEVKDDDTQKTIDARKHRRRNVVFLAAKDVLDPDYPIKKSMGKLLDGSTDIEPSVAASARDVKSKVLEPLDGLINQALKDANEQQSAEYVERFAATVLNLNGEMDARSAEIGLLHKKFSAELLDIQVNRLLSTRNIVVAAAILTAVTIGTVGYIKVKQNYAEARNVAAHVVAKDKSAENEVNPEVAKTVPAVPAITLAPSKTISVAPEVSAARKDASDSKPDTKSSKNGPLDLSKSGGNVTLSSGRDPQAMKDSIRALADAIRAWNAESEAPPAREKKPSK